MPDLRDLYQEVILDHSKHPRNFRKPEGANRHAEGYNPLCGDKVTVYLAIGDGRVQDAAFQGSGCAISTASASMMTERLRGQTVEDAEALFARFHELLTSPDVPPTPAPELGKLAAFAGVREFPMRVKCATLAWHTLRRALDEGREEAVDPAGEPA
jgi:nitrogen fixation protein NifU and related proteins